MPRRGALEPAPDAPARLGEFEIVGRLSGTNVLVGIDAVGRRAAVHILSDEEVKAARLRSAELPARRSTIPELERDLDAPLPFVAMELRQAVDLADAVAQHGPRSRIEVAGIATAVAEHLVALHRAGDADGRIRARHVLLAKDGPRIIDVVTGDTLADPTEDIRAWAEIVYLAGVGRPLEPGVSADPDDLQAFDLSMADLVVSATRTSAQERPLGETILKVLLGGRLPPEPADAVDAVITRTWKLTPELQDNLQPGEVQRSSEPVEEVEEPRRTPSDVIASGARRTVRGLATLLVVAVVVLALGYLALYVAVR